MTLVYRNGVEEAPPTVPRATAAKLPPAALPAGASHDRAPHRLDVIGRPPRVRGECAAVARPCPFLGCSFSLPGHGRAAAGSAPSCVLDVADRDGATLEDVAEALAMTRERVRQVEDKALRKVLAAWLAIDPDVLAGFADGSSLA